MRNITLTSQLILGLLISIYPFTSSYADVSNDAIFKEWIESKKPGVSPVKFQPYNDICGGCHFAYQPGLLPALAWEKIMLGMEDHFGKAVGLSPVESRTITHYLLNNSAGHINDDISNKILKTFNYDPVNIQITKTNYFIEAHSKVVNPEKKTMGQCDSCHQGAIQGRY